MACFITYVARRVKQFFEAFFFSFKVVSNFFQVVGIARRVKQFFEACNYIFPTRPNNSYYSNPQEIAEIFAIPIRALLLNWILLLNFPFQIIAQTTIMTENRSWYFQVPEPTYTGWGVQNFSKSQGLYTGRKLLRLGTCFARCIALPSPRAYIWGELGIFPSPRAYIERVAQNFYKSQSLYLGASSDFCPSM